MSDIHFGREDPDVVRRLVDKVNEIDPDLTIVSGDLTQRARSRQFAEAAKFLRRLAGPKIVVPGNHDVPLHNVFRRFADPLGKYKKYITRDLEPFFSDEEIAVVGINTARSLTVKGGRINERQIEIAQQRLCGASEANVKIVVTHHPFDLPEGFDEDDIVGRAAAAMTRFTECGADVFLAGHLHVSYIGHSARRYKLENGRTALIAQAGTAASTRVRGEPNSFNVLECDYPMLSISRLECTSGGADFLPVATERFARSKNGWERV